MLDAKRALERGGRTEDSMEIAKALNEAAKAIHDANEKLKRIVKNSIDMKQG